MIDETSEVQGDGRSDELAKMRELNIEQRKFYESRFAAKKRASDLVREEAANFVTNLWTSLRRRLQDARNEMGISDARRRLHVGWIRDVAPSRILELGCFAGNDLSLWMAERADTYVGIDLSESAIKAVEGKLRQRGLDHASAQAVDFLEADFGAATFDLVYAKSVLHHFEFLEPVLKKLSYILRPEGVVITTDPLKTEPLNRLVRAVYRPFQTDSGWEWPFTRSTFDLLDRYFVLEETQGFLGASRLASPFFILPFGERLARRIGAAGHRLDIQRASRPGPYLFNLCWQVSLFLRVREGNGSRATKHPDVA